MRRSLRGLKTGASWPSSETATQPASRRSPNSESSSPFEPWVIAPDHTTTPEWAQHLRRQEEEKKADFATVELENRNLAFERKHGMTAMAAMGIERGVNIGNTANDAKAALAAMTGEDRKEMRALVEASTGELIATAESVDTVMKLGMNHPMGPLTLADFIGLDICLNILNVMYDGFKDPKYRPCPLLVKMVEAGTLGGKTGRGFYDYSE